MMKPLRIILLLSVCLLGPGAASSVFAEMLSPRTMVAQIAQRAQEGEGYVLADQPQTAVVSYSFAPSQLLSFSADIEVLPEDNAGFDEPIVAPQLFVAVGQNIYAGVGTGLYFQGGDYAEQPFYSLKAGFDLELFPFVYLDFSADYRFDEWRLLDMADGILVEDLAVGGRLRIQF